MKKLLKLLLSVSIILLNMMPITIYAQDNVQRVVVRSVGDILIHDYLYWDAQTEKGFDFKPMLDPIKKYLEGADLTTANLEVIAAGEAYGLSSYPYFNAPVEILDALKDAGIDLVNNATNHTMDFGTEGALASIKNLQDRDIEYVGSYESWDDYNNQRVIEINGIKLGFLAYTYGVNDNYIPEDQAYLVTLIDPELMALEIELLNTKADASIVMVHNGNEYDELPNEWQLSLNALLRDAGATFILGGHPHIVQPFISYNDEQAALFSHGNLLSGQVELENKLGGIAEYTIAKEGDRVWIESMRFMPTYNVGDLHAGGYYVVPLAEAEKHGLYEAEEIFNHMQERLTYYTNRVEVVEYLD